MEQTRLKDREKPTRMMLMRTSLNNVEDIPAKSVGTLHASMGSAAALGIRQQALTLVPNWLWTQHPFGLRGRCARQRTLKRRSGSQNPDMKHKHQVARSRPTPHNDQQADGA